jgi:hypothetical protein
MDIVSSLTGMEMRWEGPSGISESSSGSAEPEELIRLKFLDLRNRKSK